MNRRDFLGGASIAAATNGLGPVSQASVLSVERRFPKDFVFGCATSAYQIEGAVHEGGRGQANWDVFSHAPGHIAGGATADIACDSYYRYREDIALMKRLGVDAHRMSIAWPRIFPEGRGAVNQKGLDHYDRVIDALLENGIQPHLTLFHWDLPAALPGGWRNRDTARAFADYAALVAAKMSDRVRNFMTVNELRIFTDLGYREGRHAPGLRLPPGEVNQVRHHGVLAHGLATQAVRASARPGAQIGLADNTAFYLPVIETSENIAAAKKATRVLNAMFVTAVMEGRYINEYLEETGPDAPRVEPGDMKAIGSPLDFVALNIYSPEWARADDGPLGFATMDNPELSPHMKSPWLVLGPEVAYWGVRQFTELWHPPKLYISENGASAGDEIIAGRIDDVDRIMYLRNYLSNFQRAVAEGYPLKGYFAWSLLDNFEWADGYTKPFGLYHVDFATQRRMPKLSASWYAKVIAERRIV